MLRIVPYPHPALRYESRPVTRIDDELRATAREMFDLMYAARGIGLAANQVGLPFRFFVLNLTADPEQKDQERVFINPEIIKRHSSIEEEEGCLSFPGLYAKVRRARKIKVASLRPRRQPRRDRGRRPPRPCHPARDRPPLRPALHRPARPARPALGDAQAPRVRSQIPTRPGRGRIPRRRRDRPATRRTGLADGRGMIDRGFPLSG